MYLFSLNSCTAVLHCPAAPGDINFDLAHFMTKHHTGKLQPNASTPHPAAVLSRGKLGVIYLTSLFCCKLSQYAEPSLIRVPQDWRVPVTQHASLHIDFHFVVNTVSYT